MRKDKLIELTQRKLVGGNPTADSMGKYHPAQLEHEIALIYDAILLEVYQAVKVKKDFSVFDSLTKPITLTVEYDEVRKEYYADINVSFVSIPNYIAVRQVYKTRSKTYSYIPQNMIVNIENSSVNKVSKKICYYFENGQIRFYRMHENPQTIVAQIVISFDEYNDSDHIPVPNGMKGTALDMIMMRMLNVNEDKLNDDKYELNVK